jgi:hypothetical protein
MNIASAKTTAFSGTIEKTTPDGRSGLVALETPKIPGKEYAVISPDTKGRIELMNGKGYLEAGTLVFGTAEIGSEGLRVLEVKTCA